MTKDELEKEYYGRRPTEPYSEDDSPNDWANIVQYAEENLDKAFKAIAELEKENAELKEQVENRNCSNCRRSRTGCPNDGSCHNFSWWQPFINPQLTKAKKIIRNCLNLWNNVMTEETVRALIKEAEQFIREEENDRNRKKSN